MTLAFMCVKIIPLYLLKKRFGPSFKFHSNLSLINLTLKKRLPVHRQILISWSHYLSASPDTPSQVLSQFLWYNNYNKIEDAVTHFEKLSNKNINFLSQLFVYCRLYHGSISKMNMSYGMTCFFREVS